MTRKQTITVNSTPGDATRAAEEVARAIRAATFATVTIGTEYRQPHGHKAGMLSVDLTIDDGPAVAPPPAATTSVEAAPAMPDLSLGPDATDEDGEEIPPRTGRRKVRA